MKGFVIIPVRYGSTGFQGEPLAALRRGRPLRTGGMPATTIGTDTLSRPLRAKETPEKRARLSLK
ncbi:MAG: hypothetical protein LUC22_03325 [Prevotella sp.]|nr:hypothetical protein [Prevotella sp.]